MKLRHVVYIEVPDDLIEGELHELRRQTLNKTWILRAKASGATHSRLVEGKPISASTTIVEEL